MSQPPVGAPAAPQGDTRRCSRGRGNHQLSDPRVPYGRWLDLLLSVYTNHLSLACPPPCSEREAFKAQLTSYKMSKSAIQFPKSALLPLKLIGEMAAFRAREAAEQTKAKG